VSKKLRSQMKFKKRLSNMSLSSCLRQKLRSLRNQLWRRQSWLNKTRRTRFLFVSLTLKRTLLFKSMRMT